MLDRIIWPLVLGMLISPTPAVAEQTDKAGAQPSANLLEYLGLLEETQDGLIGPELFDSEPLVRNPADVDPKDQLQTPTIIDETSKIKTDEAPTTRVPDDE